MKKYIIIVIAIVFCVVGSRSVFAVAPAEHELKDGDMISSSLTDDPDVYIVNEYGYKRLFLNEAIFAFYGHLGGFAQVKQVIPQTRDAFVTSGLFRNCETNDLRVFGVEVNGEDTAVLRWVNTSGAQAVLDDPEFFKKVFCINQREFNWYSLGKPFGSVSEVPRYVRQNSKTPMISLSSPSSGRTYALNSPMTVSWSGTGLDDRKTVVVSLVSNALGAGELVRAKASAGSATANLSQYIFGGDAVALITPGLYKIKVSLYDENPCLGLCAPDWPIPKLYAEDTSKDDFMIAAPMLTPTPSPLAFRNDQVGFQVGLTNNWSGYWTTNFDSPRVGQFVDFWKNWRTANGATVQLSPFRIGRMTQSQWDNRGINVRYETIILQTSDFIYYYGVGGTFPTDMADMNIAVADVPAIIASFRLLYPSTLSGNLATNFTQVGYTTNYALIAYGQTLPLFIAGNATITNALGANLTIANLQSNMMVEVRGSKNYNYPNAWDINYIKIIN